MVFRWKSLWLRQDIGKGRKRPGRLTARRSPALQLDAGRSRSLECFAGVVVCGQLRRLVVAGVVGRRPADSIRRAPAPILRAKSPNPKPTSQGTHQPLYWRGGNCSR